MFSRPGQSQGLLYKTPLSLIHSFIHALWYVAGAVFTNTSVTNWLFSWVSQWSFVKIFSKHCLSQTVRAKELKFNRMFTLRHMSHVMKWHMTPDMWHLTIDTWHLTWDMWLRVKIFSNVKFSSSAGLGVNVFWRSGWKGWLNDWISQSLTRVFVEQPRLKFSLSVVC